MMRPARPRPALLTRIRRGPSSDAASTAAFTCSSSATSALANTPPISAASFSPGASCRSSTTTLAPRCARSRAVASPRPDAPPVTIADAPVMSMRHSSVRHRRARHAPRNGLPGLLRGPPNLSPPVPPTGGGESGAENGLVPTALAVEPVEVGLTGLRGDAAIDPAHGNEGGVLGHDLLVARVGPEHV